VVAAQVGNSCRIRREDTPFSELASLDRVALGGKFTRRRA
jgi:hypothetical protein